MKKLLFFILIAIIALPVFSKKSDELNFHDGYFDKNYCLESYYSFSNEMIRVELFGKTGTFNIYCISNDKSETPLLSSSDLCDTTGFILNVDGEAYRLNKDKRVFKELHRFVNGAQLVYTIDNDVRFVIDFSFVTDEDDSFADLLKLGTYIINISGKTHDIGVKGIFDTSCGEVSSVHFTTDVGSKIRNECFFSHFDLLRERCVNSSDGKVSFQFVFDGRRVSPVESVTFANIDELYRMSWEPVIRKGRGFTNNRSYDNSAVMVKWPEINSYGEEKVENTFYIAVADNGAYPRGVFYVDRIVPEKKKDDVPEQENVNKDKRTDVDFIVPPIRDYQLDPGYIQDLIDRIDALQSSDNVDKKTVTRLNAELDAILEKLRRQ